MKQIRKLRLQKLVRKRYSLVYISQHLDMKYLSLNIIERERESV